MPVELGQGFRSTEVVAVPTGDERRHQELLAGLDALRDAVFMLAMQQPPAVSVAAPDLSEIRDALQDLDLAPVVDRVDPQAIADTVVRALDARHIEAPDRTDEVIEELRQIGRKFGKALANSAPVISNVGVKNVVGGALDTRDTALDSQYEWQAVASESVPLYIGTASPGTDTSASAWRIEKYTYTTGPTGTAVPQVVQTAVGAWDSRASLF